MLMDLFTYANEEQMKKSAPLAERMRPRTLEEFLGQREVVGPGRPLRRAIEADVLSSIILHGPPGTGKTTLA
ncbi:MAG: replication-associated recombination protein A, partial [Bacillota bacterium]